MCMYGFCFSIYFQSASIFPSLMRFILFFKTLEQMFVMSANHLGVFNSLNLLFIFGCLLASCEVTSIVQQPEMIQVQQLLSRLRIESQKFLKSKHWNITIYGLDPVVPNPLTLQGHTCVYSQECSNMNCYGPHRTAWTSSLGFWYIEESASHVPRSLAISYLTFV